MGNAKALRSVANGAGVVGRSGGPVGSAITDDLRRLQRERRAELDYDGIVAGLAPGVCRLLAAGHFVSLSATRDGRSVRVSVKDGNDWIELYTDDPDAAEDLGAQIAATFATAP